MAERAGSIKIRYGTRRFGIDRTVMPLPDRMGLIHYGARIEGATEHRPSPVLPNEKLTRLDMRKVGKNGSSSITLEGPMTHGQAVEVPLSPDGRGSERLSRGRHVIVDAATLTAEREQEKVIVHGPLTSRDSMNSENGHARRRNGGL